MRLSISALGKTIFEVSLSDNLKEGTTNIDIRTRQNNGVATPPEETAPADPAPDNVAQAQAPAQGIAAPGQAGGDAANQVAEQQAAPPPPQRRLKITVAAEQDSDEDKEYLDKMRGWLMAVATLFVNMAFQALLHPPDWLNTGWYSRNLPQLGSKAGAPLAAPAPSSPDVTRGKLLRAELYLLCNLATFGTALALAQVLLWETSKPRRTMRVVRTMMPFLSLFLAGTFALGTSDNWTRPLIVLGGVVLYAAVAVLGTLGKLNKALSVVLGCLWKLISRCFVKLFGLCYCSDNLWPFCRSAPPLPDTHEA